MKKLLPFFILVVILLIAGAIVKFKGSFNLPTKNNTSTNSPAEKEIALSKEELKKVNLEENSNLARFYQWTKEDPLFTSPDFNSEAFLDAVFALEAEEKAFPHLASPLFPIDFLKKVAEVNRYHKELIKKPSSETAEKLIVAYYQANNFYNKSAKRMYDFLNDPVTFPNRTILSFNTFTDLETIVKDFKKLVQNSRELENEIKKRELCLISGKECIIPNLSFEKPIINKNTISFSKNSFLPMKLLQPPTYKNVDQFGPFIASTPCFGWTSDFKPIMHPFYAFEGKEERNFLKTNKILPIQIEKLPTINYYQKLGSSSSDKILQNKGYSIKSLNETNIYRCNNTEYKNTLASIKKFIKNYKNSYLFKDLEAIEGPKEIKNLIKEGYALEKAFFEAEFPSEIDAENLSRYYAYTYKMILKLSQKYKSEPLMAALGEKQEYFLTRYLEYSRKLSDFDRILATVAGNFSSLRVKLILNPQKDHNYIYGTRIIYGLTYFPFSKSAYRLEEPLLYLVKKAMPVRKGFTLDDVVFTYSNARKKYSDEEILKWHIDQITPLEEAVEEYEKSHPGIKL